MWKSSFEGFFPDLYVILSHRQATIDSFFINPASGSWPE